MYRKQQEYYYIMQQVVCDFIRCAYRSQSGFCLNRLVKITEQGQCERLLKAGWQEKKEDWQLSTFNPWEVVDKRWKGRAAA